MSKKGVLFDKSTVFGEKTLTFFGIHWFLFESPHICIGLWVEIGCLKIPFILKGFPVGEL